MVSSFLSRVEPRIKAVSAPFLRRGGGLLYMRVLLFEDEWTVSNWLTLGGGKDVGATERRYSSCI